MGPRYYSKSVLILLAAIFTLTTGLHSQTTASGTVTISGSERGGWDCPNGAMSSAAASAEVIQSPPDCYWVYDTGLIRITVNGFSKSVTYGRTSTASGLASALRTAIQNDAGFPVTATVSGTVITLRAKIAGSAGNYPLTAVSYTDWPEVFATPSFTATRSAPTLTGGSDGVPAVPILNQPTAGANGTSATITWGDVATETAYYLERCAGASCNSNFVVVPPSPLPANSTAATDNGLTPGATYGYHIRASNAAGSSAWSTPIKYVTMKNRPGEPSITSIVTADDSSVTVYWADVADETAYYLERCSGDACANFTDIGSPLPANTTSFRDSNASSASTYGYRVRSYNAVGHSDYSNVGYRLRAPVITSVTPGTDGTSATVSWSDIWGETDYYVERCIGTNCTTNFAVVGSGLVATSFQNTGLASGSTYGYRVRAHNTLGYSAYSSIAYGSMPYLPADPTNLTGTFDQASVSISLVWSDNATDETGYVIERCTGSECVNFETLNDSLLANSTTYTDTSIATNTIYRYRIKAVNAVGSSGYATSSGISTNVSPTITGFLPASGPVGTTVIITGTGFGATPDGSAVTFNWIPAPCDSWSDTSLSVRVPPGATTGKLSVTTAGGQASSEVDFTVIPVPVITSISPNPAGRGSLVTISGSGFSSGGSVNFNGTAASLVDWTATSIILFVPDNATSGSVTVTANELTSNSVEFVVSPPAISALEPVQGLPGQLVTLTGSGFGVLRRDSTVSIGGTSAPVVNWSAESITVTIPSEASSGSVDVVAAVDGISSNAVSLFISKPLLLSPSNMTLYVEQEQPLQALNTDGSIVEGVTWSVDDTSIADVATDGTGGYTLIAKSVGQTVVRASASGRDAQTGVTVVPSSVEVSPGTRSWDSSALGFGSVYNIIQTRKVDENTPDFLVQEREFSPTGFVYLRLRAMTASGNQAWTWPGYALLIAADNDGGALAMTYVVGQSDFLTSISANGSARWTVPGRPYKRVETKHAIHADGTIFLAKANDALTQGSLVALDGNTGAEKFAVSVPSDTVAYVGRRRYYSPIQQKTVTVCDNTSTEYAGTTMADLGGIVVTENGEAYMPFAQKNVVYTVYCTFQPEWLPGNPPIHNVDPDGNLLVATETYSYAMSSTLGVAHATPSGGSTQIIESVSGSGPGWSGVRGFQVRESIVPDGHGGILFGGLLPDLTETIFGSNGVHRNSPVGGVSQMLLGSNDTIYVAGEGGVTALQGESPLWSSAVKSTLIAALADNSVLVSNNALQRVEQAGNASDLGIGSGLSNLTHLSGTVWAGAGSNGEMTVTAANLLIPDEAISAVGSYKGGNKQAQSSPPRDLVPLPSPQREAIHAALAALIQRVSNCTLCQSYVFDKVTDANYFPIAQSHFVSWLTELQPMFYDGTKSTAKINGNASPWDFWAALGTGRTIDRYFGLNWDTDAMTCTGRPHGCGPFKSFFRPSAIDTSEAGVNENNLALLFHEALHGITGLVDSELQPALGCKIQDDTHNISEYLRQFVKLTQPQTIAPCD